MKRFWSEVSVRREDGGFAILLDGRPVRTPGRQPLEVRSEALAQAIAGEWRAVQGEVDPRLMPLTGLANAAIDRIAPDKDAFAAGLARYAESDLTCYRAASPKELHDVQSTAWDALLGWARRRYDVDFVTTQGVLHVDQPAATVERLAHAVAALDPFQLAGLSPLVTIGGSLVAALAVLDGAITADHAWDSVSIDERWQIEQWGADEEALATLHDRKRDFLVAARFLDLLDSGTP